MAASKIEPEPLSFIIKIWLEETAGETGRVVWRGHVTHVPSRERRYFADLRGMLDFMTQYMRQLGIESAGEVEPKT